MANQTKKQRRTKKRKEIVKRRRARKASLPALLRENPDLHETLNCHHPLVSCLINENWRDGRMANIQVIREAPTGLVLSSFLVDLAGVGLKDAWGNYGLSKAEINRLESKYSAANNPLVGCDLSLANTIVHGGVAWARKWGFKLPKDHKIWLRLLEPVDPAEIDLDLFGENGMPLLILNEDEVDLPEWETFDPEILKGTIEADRDGPSRETLTRIGDIKGALLSFLGRSEIQEDLDAAFEKRFGKEGKPDSEEQWIAFQDWFALEYELQGGGTVAQRFVEEYEDVISHDVRELVLGWQNVIEGLFEVKARESDGYCMKSLINEREYEVYPTVFLDKFEMKPGDFAVARVVPAKGFHTFSGGVKMLQSDGSEDMRAEIYKVAIDFQIKNRRLALKDNEEKLKKSLESARRQYEDFVDFFGSDEVCGTGKEISVKYQSFCYYVVFEKKDPDTGQPVAKAYETETGRPYQPPKVALPKDVLKSTDVGMICDSVEGLEFLIEYQRFFDTFQYPQQHLGKEETEDLVLGYLESDLVSDLPFRKVAKKFPYNFSRVMGYYLDREAVSADSIDDLMQEFKPDTFDKLPGIVVLLDSEMGRLARLAAEEEAEKESRSLFDKFKGAESGTSIRK